MSALFRTVSLILLPAVLLLAGCGSPYRAPVDELGGEERFLNAGRTHRVNAGETLYAVAWIYGLDYLALARANDLDDPYTIYPGQELLVDLRAAEAGSTAATGDPARAAGTAAVRVNPVGEGVSVQRANLPDSGLSRQSLPGNEPAGAVIAGGMDRPRPRAEPSVAVPGMDKPKPRPEPQTAATPEQGMDSPRPRQQTPSEQPRPAPVIADRQPAPVVEAPPQPTPAPVRQPADDEIRWDWPAPGAVIAGYSATDMDRRGLDIAGRRGEEVKAAADGLVVYAGSGLLRYGDLIILKHNDNFLSAYAHNDRLLVREGQRVLRGEPIAELGSSGIDRTMLHFEIRKGGQPVDPQPYLPSR